MPGPDFVAISVIDVKILQWISKNCDLLVKKITGSVLWIRPLENSNSIHQSNTFNSCLDI